MNDAFLAPLAATNPPSLKQLTRSFRGQYVAPRSSAYVYETILLAIALIVAAAVAFVVWRQLRDRREMTNSLFDGLCGAHELTRRERRLLDRLARCQRLAEPARLFLEPERWDPNHLPGELAAEAETLALLKTRLFA